ncbi:MAG: hypothetical protein HQK65_23275 [Desulfamplus sp.]|nr:hypothetical protein [Desulfamplus sp.]
MTLEQDLKNLLVKNLDTDNIHDAMINIKKDTFTFNGWRVAVISDDFENWTESRRRNTLLKGIEIPVTWLFVGTKQERKEAGYTEDALEMVPNTNTQKPPPKTQPPPPYGPMLYLKQAREQTLFILPALKKTSPPH